MAFSEPLSGLKTSLQILNDVNKCIICQKNKNNKGLTSTEKEGKVLLVAQVI